MCLLPCFSDAHPFTKAINQKLTALKQNSTQLINKYNSDYQGKGSINYRGGVGFSFFLHG